MQATGGATALMYACQQCRENEVLEILRKQPQSVKDRDRTYKTPLHYCAENPNSSCAEAILKAAPELANAQDENGYCTLHLAVIAGNKPLIKLLIAKGADVNIHDNEGHSAVHWAIVSSEKEALEMIIRAGASPSTADIHGGYPLHYAVQMCGCNCDHVRDFEDTVRVVEALLNFGVDVSVKDKDGRQPILWAASAGSADAVVHLVSAGACVEAADKDGLTALHCAASRGHTATLETLISLCGANVDVIDANGCSALFYSVTLGHADATELLLKLGAEPNRQDRKGRTPAHCGAAKGQLETLRILQKHGGNLWMRNVKGDIPLHEAVASGRKELVLWLLSQCSEAINLANNDGRCPLHIAAMYNNTEMVKVLLDSKSLVNPVMRTSKGVLMTPLNVALSKGHRSCGKYLQLHGGVPFSKVSRAEPASGFALRVSPPNDAVIVTAEKSEDNMMVSQMKISKSRSSTDNREVTDKENREVSKPETADKKKVYRRRKKKKNASNTQDSDTDDSAHELKVKTPSQRKNHDEEKIKHPKETNSSVAIKTEQTVKESVTRTTKTGTESKPLQRNKSFNETKNVSDLSPEDFPPLMQSISHLDIVIMEPDVEAAKPESENNAGRSADSIIVTVEDKEDGGNVKTVPVNAHEVKISQTEETDPTIIEKTIETEKQVKESSPFQENVEKKTEIKMEEKEQDGKEVPSDQEKPREESNMEKSGDKEDGEKEDSFQEKPEEETEIKIDEKTNDKERKEDYFQEKPGKSVKKSNGNSRKDEAKTSGWKSSDETTTRRSIRSPKSLSDGDTNKKNSKGRKKTGLEKSDHKEVITAEDSKTNDRNAEPQLNEEEKNEKSVSSESKPVGTEETPKTESEISTEVASQPVDLPEEVERTSGNPPTETNAVAKASDSATRLGSPIREETSKLDLENTSPEKEEIKLLETRTIVEDEATEKEIPVAVAETNAVERDNVTINGGEDSLPSGNAESEEIVEKTAETSETTVISEKQNSGEVEIKAEGATIEELRDENIVELREEKLAGFDESEKQEKENGEKPAKQDNSMEEELTLNGKNNLEGLEKKDKTEEQEMDAPDGSSEKKTGFFMDRHFKTPRVSRLCRRNKDFKDEANQISVTQLVQNTLRKYHMERGIFYQLLELKRYQIRSGRANEQVLVKRLADEYERSRVFLGMKPFSGLYKFKEFEKFLYDQLKALNSRRSYIIPEVKSYDDIDALSGFLKKSRYKILSETPTEMLCTCITQRCHHSACAYTNVPCSAYITDLRRHRYRRPRRESFFPRIEQEPPAKPDKERPATLELVQGSEKHVITLPQNSPGRGKRYYVTFTIKGAPSFKEGDYADESKEYFKHRHAKSV